MLETFLHRRSEFEGPEKLIRENEIEIDGFSRRCEFVIFGAVMFAE